MNRVRHARDAAEESLDGGADQALHSWIRRRKRGNEVAAVHGGACVAGAAGMAVDWEKLRR